MPDQHRRSDKRFSLAGVLLEACVGFCLGGLLAYFVFFVTAATIHVVLPSFRLESGPYGAPVPVDPRSQLLHAIPVAFSTVTARWFLKRWTPLTIAFAAAGWMLALLIAFR